MKKTSNYSPFHNQHTVKLFPLHLCKGCLSLTMQSIASICLPSYKYRLQLASSQEVHASQSAQRGRKKVRKEYQQTRDKKTSICSDGLPFEQGQSGQSYHAGQQIHVAGHNPPPLHKSHLELHLLPRHYYFEQQPCTASQVASVQPAKNMSFKKNIKITSQTPDKLKREKNSTSSRSLNLSHNIHNTGVINTKSKDI